MGGEGVGIQTARNGMTGEEGARGWTKSDSRTLGREKRANEKCKAGRVSSALCLVRWTSFHPTSTEVHGASADYRVRAHLYSVAYHVLAQELQHLIQ